MLPEREPKIARADASYLITGGLGGLGLVLSEWLADQGALHLALLGRSEPNAHARDVIARLRARGVEVRVFACDVSRSEQVHDVIANVQATMPQLAGVIDRLRGQVVPPRARCAADDGLDRQIADAAADVEHRSVAEAGPLERVDERLRHTGDGRVLQGLPIPAVDPVVEAAALGLARTVLGLAHHPNISEAADGQNPSTRTVGW